MTETNVHREIANRDARITELTATVERLTARRFPILRGGSIPWPVAELAYIAYAQKYGTSQSLERMAERGGFDVGELDMFVPDWREMVLRAEVPAECECKATVERLEREKEELRRATKRPIDFTDWPERARRVAFKVQKCPDCQSFSKAVRDPQLCPIHAGKAANILVAAISAERSGS